MRRTLAVLSLTLAFAPAAQAACPPVSEVARLAGAIVDRVQAPPPPTGLSMVDALCARDRLIAVFAQAWGDQQGWKVGPAGVPGAPPLSGAVFFGTLRENSGAALPARFGTAPMVSAGLLMRIRDDAVNDAGEDQLALLRQVEAVVPFIDLPDMIYDPAPSWTPILLTSIDLGTRLGVLGEPVPVQPTADFARALGAMTVTLQADGAEVARGTGSAGPGHPLAALAWLVRDLKEQGRPLRGGEVVLVAGLTPPIAATPREHVATFVGLAPQPASVSVRLQ